MKMQTGTERENMTTNYCLKNSQCQLKALCFGKPIYFKEQKTKDKVLCIDQGHTTNQQYHFLTPSLLPRQKICPSSEI